jgi:hypothetical protein
MDILWQHIQASIRADLVQRRIFDGTMGRGPVSIALSSRIVSISIGGDDFALGVVDIDVVVAIYVGTI